MSHSPNIIQTLARDFTLSDKNADPANWQWEEKSQPPWETAHEDWEHFRAKWYGATESQSASPTLSLEPLPPAVDPSVTSTIIVRESYLSMFDTVWAKGISLGGSTGVIITGQPGTGKTLFLYYLLVRLLQRKQVVLFSPEGNKVYLFYFNHVYTAGMGELDAQDVDLSLPEPISSSNVFMWSLFDIRERKEPAKFMVCRPCLPVQTTSLDPSRYKIWRKERMPLRTGLPLWTRAELTQGLQYQWMYHPLQDALHAVYSSDPRNLRPLYRFHGAKHLLMEEGTLPSSPKDALDYLLSAAIDRFGYSARDVFGAVFDFQTMTDEHEEAFPYRYTDLLDTVSTFSRKACSDYSTSYEILAMSPVNQGPLAPDKWELDFKSEWVAGRVMQNLLNEVLLSVVDDTIRQQISVFWNIPETRGFAGRLLEPFAHCQMANTVGDPWPLITMLPNHADSPKFTEKRNFPVPHDVLFVKTKRNIVKLQSIGDLSTRLENNSYYIPMGPNFPLFDAFTIQLDHVEKLAILWVLQMTTSPQHGGSAEGYQKIREIVAILKNNLRVGTNAGGQAIPEPYVQVRYVLVMPKDGPPSQELQWEFPQGWSQFNHRGQVYSLEVPLESPSPGMVYECIWI